MTQEPESAPQDRPQRTNRKALMLGAGALGLVLVLGAVIALASGGSDVPDVPDVPAVSPPAAKESAVPTPSGSPGVTGPYTKVTSPCGWVSQDTIAELVPFTRFSSAESDDGPGAEGAFASCAWESKFQGGSEKQISRNLEVKLRLHVASDSRDAVGEAGWFMEYQRGVAGEHANKTDDFGDKHGAVTAPQIGDEAFVSSMLAHYNIQVGVAFVRVGNLTAEIGYEGDDHPTDGMLLPNGKVDESKRTPIAEAAVREGAEAVAAQIAAGIKSCTDLCTGQPAVSEPDRQEDAAVAPIAPSWKKDVLDKPVDPCALLKQETLGRLVPRGEMTRRLDDGYYSGKDGTYGECAWDYPKDGSSPRKLQVVFLYGTGVSRGKDWFEAAKNRLDGQANGDLAGTRYGPVEALTGLGDQAVAQTGTSDLSGEAQLLMRVGNVVLEISYLGADYTPDTVPLPEDKVLAEAKAAAQDIVSILRP
ncbi:hypothetical protein ABGB12_27095 [Actinocorallia sp. B10E7]|uniref:hypothetical protein n=1 Tax=Actinocorallia sp. B10E7 TaxID=3153558 RepID=UPI00325F84A8